MTEADIIPINPIVPIGARGTAGRGSRRSTTPSAASRTLAGRPKVRPTTSAEPVPATPGAHPAGEPATDPATPPPPRAPGRAGTAPTRPAGGPATRPVGRATAATKPAAERRTRPVVAAADEPAPGEPGQGARHRQGPLDEVVGLLSDLASRVGLPGLGLLPDLPGLPRLGDIGLSDLGFGEDAEERVAELVAFARRRLTGDFAVDDFGLDPEFTESVLLPLIRPLYRSWFRVEVRGVENIPTEGAALIVANHSGTIALDAVMTHVAVHDETPQHRFLRLLGADLVFRTPVLGEVARKYGATLACNEDASRLLEQGELVGVWPEGFKGVGKPFSERYKLQRFGRGGFVTAALRAKAPIVPTAIVGAEETYPIIGNMPVLARLIGAPYVPVTPFFPWLGPLGLIPLPSKWIIEFGEPIPTDSLPESAADDPMAVFNIGDQVREHIQQNLYSLLMQRRNVFF